MMRLHFFINFVANAQVKHSLLIINKFGFFRKNGTEKIKLLPQEENLIGIIFLHKSFSARILFLLQDLFLKAVCNKNLAFLSKIPSKKTNFLAATE